MPKHTDPVPAYRADCPTRPILDQIGDKWSMMILAVLLPGPLRFNAIKRQLEGITQRVLTQTLRKLERNGMLSRRVLDGSPPGVEYQLTPLGRSLEAPVSALYDWTLAHIDAIEKHQRAFDRAHARSDADVTGNETKGRHAGRR